MYRRPTFLNALLDIRQEMAREADYDLDLFAALVRSGRMADKGVIHILEDGAEEPIVPDVPAAGQTSSKS